MRCDHALTIESEFPARARGPNHHVSQVSNRGAARPERSTHLFKNEATMLFLLMIIPLFQSCPDFGMLSLHAGCRCKLGGLQSVNVCMKKKAGLHCNPAFFGQSPPRLSRIDFAGPPLTILLRILDG